MFALCVCVAWWPMRDSCALIAKFHYTDPTRPARTRTDFFAARVSEKLRWVRAGLRQRPCGSLWVRAGPVGSLNAKFHYTDPRGLCLVGSGRARVVEFSYYSVSHNTDTDGHRAIASTHAGI